MVENVTRASRGMGAIDRHVSSCQLTDPRSIWLSVEWNRSTWAGNGEEEKRSDEICSSELIGKEGWVEREGLAPPFRG